MRRYTISLTLAATLPLAGASAQTPLEYCGFQNVHLVMEQIPATWWSYPINETAMWVWNQYVDLYRFVPNDGGWGQNGDSEFAGWPTQADLQATWGFSWGSAIALCVYTWGCECCEITESDVLFNPSNSWTSDASFAEGNASVIFYTSVLMHELGHTWGEQTRNENYDYDVPTVMHLYYPFSVHNRYTIHAADAYLIRRAYLGNATEPPRSDMAVFSHFANAGQSNTTTDASQYIAGSPITVQGITVENTGNSATADAHVRLYLSTNDIISTGDTLLGDWFWTSFPAEAWGSYDLTGTIPSTLAPGTYYVGAIVSSNGYGGDDLIENDTTHLFGQVVVNPIPCSDDWLEPNDLSSQAPALAPGFYGGLQVCDPDWYRVFVSQNHDLDVSIQFSDAVGDLDLQLFDASLNLVDGSYSVTDGEAVSIASVPTAGFYYIHAYGWSGAQNAYSMDIDVTARPASCTFRNGSGVNPAQFTCLTAPAIGTMWRTSITTTPATVSTCVLLAAQPDAGFLLSGMEVLIDVSSAVSVVPGFATHDIAIPNSASMIGESFSTQGLRVEAAGSGFNLRFLNAQDLTIGV